MKTSDSMIGGTLLPSSYAPRAAYFVQFVKLYEAAGVPNFTVTPQNEPLNIPGDYPGMDMKAEEQELFVCENLRPAFRAAKRKTKILIFDHNWDLIAFPDTVLKDSHAAQFVVGTARHCYGGDPAAQTELHDRFPDKEFGSPNVPAGIGKKAIFSWSKPISSSKRHAIGGKASCSGI
jgi:glucosylceramidase